MRSFDKTTYKLLKKLYKEAGISADSANEFTGIEKNSRNPYVDELLEEKLIMHFQVKEEKDGYGGQKDVVFYYKITLKGCAYVEEKRRALLNFWLPYGITTLIALAALAVAVCDLLLKGQC